MLRYELSQSRILSVAQLQLYLGECIARLLQCKFTRPLCGRSMTQMAFNEALAVRVMTVTQRFRNTLHLFRPHSG